MPPRQSPDYKAPRPGGDTKLDASVLAQLAELKQLSVNELKAKWAMIFDTPAPNNSRQNLELRIGYRIQELTYGGVSRDTRRTLDLLADEVQGKLIRKPMIADPRTPVVGTRLVRDWNGIQHTITVLREGYDFNGRKYKSLSAIARAITGTRWNGYRFFGLRAAKRSKR